MRHYTIPFDKVKALSKRDVDYQLHTEKFSPFYSYEPSMSGLQQAISNRKNFPVDRKMLVAALKDQSKHVELSDAQLKNINALENEDTFTVITAHQPSLLTGPAYFVIKILSTLKLAQELNTSSSGYSIVPVFIIGGEDHDFEEINHLHLFGKNIQWETTAGGAVGRMKLDGLDNVIKEVNEILGDSEHALMINKMIHTAFNQATDYGSFMYNLVHLMFKDYGLVIASMDDVNMKKAFVPFMKKELLDAPSHELVQKTQVEIEKLGYSGQAFPREINLFYLLENQRERIVLEGDKYMVLNTDIEWSKDELLDELSENPQKFSPNVVLRPIYQEVVWPNIAYIGGGGELAYWLERKTQFEHFGVFMPSLIRRNSLMMVSKSQMKHMQKLNLEDYDLFLEEYEIINKFLQSQTSFDINLSAEIQDASEIFQRIKNKAEQADPNLGPFAAAEETRILKQMENIESRIKRSVKKREETSVKQIKNLKSKLFPNNGLQERHDNFFQFYLTEGQTILDELINILNPLNKEFVVLCEE